LLVAVLSCGLCWEYLQPWFMVVLDFGFLEAWE
jgi:hypothetical protein